MSSSASSTTSSSNDASLTQDTMFNFDEKTQQKLLDAHPWTNDVHYFQDVRVSATAAMKMLKHSLSGVEKGQAATGMSVEVMGLMIGKVVGHSIVVLDTIALPVEGENNFVTDSDRVQMFQCKLLDSMELRRQERFVGWYHSHPFDVESVDHCFMSATDVQTQTANQMSLSTWTALVVDPLRSLNKSSLVCAAYRTYPPSHTTPKTQRPDHRMPSDQRAVATKQWGATPDRYYQLPVTYFMSSLGKRLADTMSRRHLWLKPLATTPGNEPDSRRGVLARTTAVNTQLSSATAAAMQQAERRGGRGGGVGSLYHAMDDRRRGPGGRGGGGGEHDDDDTDTMLMDLLAGAGGRHHMGKRGMGGGINAQAVSLPPAAMTELTAAAEQAAALAVEQLCGQTAATVKAAVFNAAGDGGSAGDGAGVVGDVDAMDTD